MTTLVTLTEAASYLGVSKATLRNWDKAGKLKAHRHPMNQYRAYDLDELRQLKPQASLLEEIERSTSNPQISVADSRSVKRVTARLHAILRDTDGDSSIVQRFDELSKLLYLKLVGEKAGAPGVFEKRGETTTQYAHRIRDAYKAQADQHQQIIAQQFRQLRCSDQAIYECGVVLSSLSFADATFDVKGIAYEEVIRGTFDKGDNQQFFTPHQVVSSMVAFMKPWLAGVIGDPACGTGGFLAEITRATSRYKKLVGLEIDERLRWVAGINLLLHGASQFAIECLPNGGTLGEHAKPFHNSLDVILTNPPFGSDFSDSRALNSFVLGQGKVSRRRGILFIERCLELLKDGGYLAIVIDEGVLNLPSAQDVRRFVLERFDILGIVSLPETAFMPYAMVNASIMYLRKSAKGRRSKRVFFAKAEEIGRKSNGDDEIIYDDKGGGRPNSDLPQILVLWEQHLAGHTIPSTELAFVANVSDSLKTDESLRLDFRYHHPSRSISKLLLQHAKYPIHTLADICEERNDSVIPSTELQDQLILYTGLANIESRTGAAQQIPTPTASLKSAVKRYEPNDIVFGRMRPNLRKVALMAFAEGGYVSAECSVLKVRQNGHGNPIFDPAILAAVLRSDLVFGQIMHLIAGIGRPRLNVTDLRTIRIPVPPDAVQRVARSAFEGSMASADQLRATAMAMVYESNSLRLRAVEDLATTLIDNPTG